MESVVASRRSICSISVYPWQAPRLPGQSSSGETKLCINPRDPSNLSHARYGTPFLLSLGVSEHITSLVWLAGPISGLIAQPVIGESETGWPSPSHVAFI